MKKGLIFKSLAAGAVLYAAAGFLGVPYLIKHIAPEQISEATKGGQFSVEDASFNPFSFHLKLRFAIFKTPEGEELARLGKLSLNVDPFAYLWTGKWVVKEISLSGLGVRVVRSKEGDFNFKWLTELGEEKPKEEPSSPPKLLIRHFTFEEGSLDYRDYSEGKSYKLGVGPIGFDLDNIDLDDLSGTNGMLHLHAAINDGGFVEIKGNIESASPIRVRGSVAFDSGKLYTPWRYFKEKFPIEVADGVARFGFDYRFDGDDINATELSKLNANVSKLRVIPKGDGNHDLLKVASIRLSNASVFPLRKTFEAVAADVDGIKFAARRDRKGTIDWIDYLEQIQKAFPEEENETKVPWKFSIGRVGVGIDSLEWYDDAPTERYHASATGISVRTGEISSDENRTIHAFVSAGEIGVFRSKDAGKVASLAGLSVDGIEVGRAAHSAYVGNVSLHSPFAALKREKDGTIDVSRLFYASGKKGNDKAEPSAPWTYAIGEIGVMGGEVRFADRVPSREADFIVDELALNGKGFDSDPAKPVKLDVSARMNAKAMFRVNADLVRERLASRGQFSVRNLDLAMLDPYIEPATYASLRRGDLSVAGDYRYDSGKASVRGKVALNDWVLNDSRDDSVLLGWHSIGVTPFAYAYPDNRLKINELAVDGLYANALIDAKKVFNFSTLSKTAKGDANTTAPQSKSNPFGIDIVKLLVRNSSATFSDQSLPLPFKTYIHDLEGSVLGISTTKDVTTFVKLRGGVDQYGLSRIDGSLNTKAPKQFTDLKVSFDNLDLKNYTPYSLEFLGYKIDGGKLVLNLGYKIDNGQLKGKNQVVIRQIELGEEKQGGSPWPMRLVVALLEDSDRVIDIDLPVEGDVNKPDFRYGKVVWQAFTNILTKAVTSPFRLLGSMLGIEGDKLSSIDFEPGSNALLPPQVEKLDQIVQLLQKRPKLSLQLQGAWDEVNDPHALKAHKLVQSALKRNKELKIDSPQAMSLELLEDMAEDVMERKELRALREEMEKQYPEEAAYVRHYSNELIERLIARQSVSPQELSALAQKRSDTIREYLLKTPGMEKRLLIKATGTTKASKEGDVGCALEVIVP